MKDKEIIGLFFARDELALVETEKKIRIGIKMPGGKYTERLS